MIADHPEVTWQGTLETNRGCPYACTFCDWGSLTYNKVKKFELERVFDELEWMARRNFDWISITDANFGMYPERDGMIADKIIEMQEKYGSPRTFQCGLGQESKERSHRHCEETAGCTWLQSRPHTECTEFGS
jgi:radical SAM superfamily enzyme YgiQ (UPF0313 family)